VSDIIERGTSSGWSLICLFLLRPRYPFLFVRFLCDLGQCPHHNTSAGTRASSPAIRDTSDHSYIQIYFVGIGSEFVYPTLSPTRPPPDSTLSLHSIEIVLHSILTCRLMIGIREASQSFGHKSETFELSDVPCHSTLEFAPKSPGESV